MTIYNAYGELAELIASLPATRVMALRAGTEMQNRYNFLVEKVKNNQLTAREKDELDHFIVLERLIRLAKIRADSAKHG